MPRHIEETRSRIGWYRYYSNRMRWRIIWLFSMVKSQPNNQNNICIYAVYRSLSPVRVNDSFQCHWTHGTIIRKRDRYACHTDDKRRQKQRNNPKHKNIGCLLFFLIFLLSNVWIAYKYNNGHNNIIFERANANVPFYFVALIWPRWWSNCMYVYNMAHHQHI